MRQVRALIRAAIFGGVTAFLLSSPALAATTTPSAAPKGKGLCPPWHSCVAKGLLALVVLYCVMVGGMYLYQRRGFGKLEHRQGNPDGVPVKHE